MMTSWVTLVGPDDNETTRQLLETRSELSYVMSYNADMMNIALCEFERGFQPFVFAGIFCSLRLI